MQLAPKRRSNQTHAQRGPSGLARTLALKPSQMFGRVFALVGGGGPSLPYNVGEAYDSSWGSWTHCRGDSKEDGSPVSVFRISAANKEDAKLVAARNGVKRLRMVGLFTPNPMPTKVGISQRAGCEPDQARPATQLRHPNVLQFRDTVELEERGETVIYVVTEPVTPLAVHLASLDLQGPQRSQYIAMGIYHCAKALSFLNNDCKLVSGAARSQR